MGGKHPIKSELTYRERDQLHEAILHERAKYGGGPGWVATLALEVGIHFDRDKLGDGGIPAYVDRKAFELEKRRTRRSRPDEKPTSETASAGAIGVM